VRTAVRAKPRTLQAPRVRAARRRAFRSHVPCRRDSLAAATRAALGRVRPLRVLPRNVVPYVKH